MRNPVPTRIHAFLEEIPPFTQMAGPELMALCENVVIRYVPKDEVIFRQGEKTGEFVFIVSEGAVVLEKETEKGRELFDQCGEGDLFGIRPVIARESYQLTARAVEETLLYQIRVHDIRKVISSQPEAAMYLAEQFAAGVYRRFSHFDPENKEAGYKFTEAPMAGAFLEEEAGKYGKTPVTCSMDLPVRDVAASMRAHNVGSMIVVDEQDHPAGILTDRDLRNRIATGDLSPAEPVSRIMSSPVVTRGPHTKIATIQLTMMQNRIHHICLTADGTPGSRVVGVLSQHDLLVMQGSHPAILLREIPRCPDGAALGGVRKQAERWMHHHLTRNTGVSLVTEVMTRINDGVLHRAIRLGAEKAGLSEHEKEGLKWCWLSLGSSGRGEQLLRTDQDHAIVFQIPDPARAPVVKEKLLELAVETSQLLAAAGYAYCPSSVMASNPEWCNPLAAWKAVFSAWIKEPTEENLMYCGIFFDFRPVYGDVNLAENLAHHIVAEIGKKEIFLNFLARAAIHTPPPLTFFRNLLVEKKGAHQDQFDLKARALMPLVDAARVLILDARKPGIRATTARFSFLSEKEGANSSMFRQAVEAFEFMQRLRALHGMKHQSQGRYIQPDDLTRMEKVLLRNTFSLISDLQELIRVRFQLSLFM